MQLTNLSYTGSGNFPIQPSCERHFFLRYKNNFSITYDLGDMPIYCYRISGRGKIPYMFKPPIGNNEIVYSQIYNVFARSITELPKYLKENNFTGWVFKVFKYEKAVYNQDYLNDVANGVVDPNNYGFIDVTKQFCKLPDASDFCQPFYEVVAKVTFAASYTKYFESSGSFKLKGHSVVTKSSYYQYKVKKRKIKNHQIFNGSATVVGTNLLPSFSQNSVGTLKISGSAKNQNNYLGLIQVFALGNLEIINENNYNYNPKDHIFDPIGTNNILAAACGCPSNTNLIYFNNTIFKKNSLLDKFLYRNNLIANDTIKLFYDNKNKYYSNTIKYDGLSLLENNKESWNIISTLNCTNQLDFNKNPLWSFSCSIVRKFYNNNKSNALESKLSILLPANKICSSVDAMEFYYRINLKEMVVYNKFKDKITNIKISVFKDNIKLFSSGDWLTNPFFNIFVYSKIVNQQQYFRPMVAIPQEDIRNAITGRQEIIQT